MPGCPTYSGPRHEAIPEAGNITPFLRLDNLVHPEIAQEGDLNASLPGVQVGPNARGI